MEIESKNNNAMEQEDNGSHPDDEIEIAGGDQIVDEMPEESQNEIERLEKLDNEKKKFLEEIQDSKTDESKEVNKNV